ncbi:hypothetical protein GCM10023322_68480 [Rugosimonospora acidiphila]|uniref:Trypsin-co-occurring domain-containing protein n=1 Tax=Rugosimonospora acidiphila TaxID=556531 RepID=A0ABP9SLI9_9ACTN
MVDDEFVELAEAIAVLRDQLGAAREAGEGASPRFAVGPVEVEFTIEARRNVDGKVGVQFGVFTAGGQGGGSSAATHRVKLTLTPHSDDGGDFEVHGSITSPPSR